MKRRIFAFSGLFILFLLLSTFSSNALAIQYKVKSGDSLFSISKKFGVSVKQIKQSNNIQKSKIKQNQVLNISTKSSSKHANKSKSEPSYTVKKGDTLSKIAKKTQVPIKNIMVLNHVKNKKLRIGQKIVLAKSELVKVKRIRAEDNAVNDDSSASTNEDEEDTFDSFGTEESLGTWDSPDEVKSLVKVATGFTGTPYEFGGSSLRGEGIDCSSFVQQIYRKFDVKLPRSAREQAKVGIRISRKALMKGDLVFFKTYHSFGHVGIYIGNHKFVHAATEGGVVRIDSIDTPYYQKRFQRAVRVKGFKYIGA
jgi:cell wall-associated NlpC family hydrolase